MIRSTGFSSQDAKQSYLTIRKQIIEIVDSSIVDDLKKITVLNLGEKHECFMRVRTEDDNTYIEISDVHKEKVHSSIVCCGDNTPRTYLDKLRHPHWQLCG